LWLSLLLGLAAFALDRGQKFYQIEVMGWRGGEGITVTPFFDYVLVWNTGISYGLLDRLPVIVLGLLMLAAIVALGIWWWRNKAPLVRAGLALCLGGALSNTLDRALYGAVADFFHFHWGTASFYIFNLADAAITLGVALLFIDMARARRARADAATGP
jgi:signal peptidase II